MANQIVSNKAKLTKEVKAKDIELAVDIVKRIQKDLLTVYAETRGINVSAPVGLYVAELVGDLGSNSHTNRKPESDVAKLERTLTEAYQKPIALRDIQVAADEINTLFARRDFVALAMVHDYAINLIRAGTPSQELSGDNRYESAQKHQPPHQHRRLHARGSSDK